VHTDVEPRARVVAPKHRGSGLAQWGILLTPIAAAYVQQQLSFVFVTWACSRNATILVHLPTLVALVLTALAAWYAWRALRGVGPRAPEDERSSDARARYMSFSTLVLAGFCVVLIVAQWLPAAMIHPCLR